MKVKIEEILPDGSVLCNDGVLRYPAMRGDYKIGDWVVINDNLILSHRSSVTPSTIITESEVSATKASCPDNSQLIILKYYDGTWEYFCLSFDNGDYKKLTGMSDSRIVSVSSKLLNCEDHFNIPAPIGNNTWWKLVNDGKIYFLMGNSTYTHLDEVNYISTGEREIETYVRRGVFAYMKENSASTCVPILYNYPHVHITYLTGGWGLMRYTDTNSYFDKALTLTDFPIYYDSTNNQLYYCSGTFKSAWTKTAESPGLMVVTESELVWVDTTVNKVDLSSGGLSSINLMGNMKDTIKDTIHGWGFITLEEFCTGSYNKDSYCNACECGAIAELNYPACVLGKVNHSDDGTDYFNLANGAGFTARVGYKSETDNHWHFYIDYQPSSFSYTPNPGYISIATDDNLNVNESIFIDTYLYQYTPSDPDYMPGTSYYSTTVSNYKSYFLLERTSNNYEYNSGGDQDKNLWEYTEDYTISINDKDFYFHKYINNIWGFNADLMEAYTFLSVAPMAWLVNESSTDIGALAYGKWEAYDYDNYYEKTTEHTLVKNTVYYKTFWKLKLWTDTWEKEYSLENTSTTLTPDWVEEYLLELHNNARGSNDLTLDMGSLKSMAQFHSDDMAKYHYFEHTGYFGDTVEDRFLDWGINFNTYGENIGAIESGSLTKSNIKQMFDDWMDSPGHRANILNEAFTRMGVGYTYDSTEGQWKFTVDFADKDPQYIVGSDYTLQSTQCKLSDGTFIPAFSWGCSGAEIRDVTIFKAQDNYLLISYLITSVSKDYSPVSDPCSGGTAGYGVYSEEITNRVFMYINSNGEVVWKGTLPSKLKYANVACFKKIE